MKEIKFRGKCTYEFCNHRGKWIYGGVCDYGSGASIFIINQSSGSLYEPPYTELEEFDVDRETIGQYTGLTDKNGKEIYEGDIVRLHQLDTPKEIRWDDKQSRWCLIQDGYPVAGCNEETLKSYEIIGNIFDNTGLLRD